MLRFNMVLSQICFFLLFFQSVSGEQTAWTDEHVLQALGDHGDRITDLEKIVIALSSGHASLLQEVTNLKTTNAQLLLQMKNITDNCLSYLKCSNSDKSVTTTTVSRQSAETTTVSTSMPVNMSATDMSTHMSQSTIDLNTQSTHVGTNTTHSTTPMNIATTQSSITIVSTAGKTTAMKTTLPPATTTTSPRAFKNCREAVTATGKINGTFDIKVGSTGAITPVYCEVMDGEAWLVIQRRQDGSVDFNRNWQAYRNGFGELFGEFWLGNEKLHAMTSDDVYTLRIDMGDWGGNHPYAEYDHFEVGSELTNYRLTVGSYRGTAGDSFHYPDSSLLQHNSIHFSTPDRDNDYSFMNCADKLHSGWWFNSCYSSNLNGKYLKLPYGQRVLGESSGQPTLEGTGIEWYPYRHRQYSMRSVEMKIKLANSGSRLIGRK